MTELPRYNLGVGDRLTYRMTGDANRPANGAGGSSRFSVDWDFHVVACHGASSWRLVFSESHTHEHDFASGERTTRTTDMDGFFDVTDDGRLVENWTITPMANPAIVFPQLPAERSQMASGWHSSLQLDKAQRNYTAAGSDATQQGSNWRFAEDSQTELDPVYQVRRHREYDFDLQRGLISQVTTSIRRGWPLESSSAVFTDTIQLVEVAKSAALDSARMHQEADRYFAVCAEYQRLIDLSLWDLPHASRWLDQAADTLAELEADLRVQFVCEMLRRKLQLHERERGGMLADAERLADMIDTPAVGWQCADLDGTPRSLNDYKGTVLVLCFWNRGCTWAIRTLLAINALAAELRGAPIAFLGVNVDRKREDAAFVWRTLDFAFPTIIDVPGEHAVARAYGIDSYPTTVVIDPCGIIRRMRAGYSYRLSSTLESELASLIGKEPCANQ
jgi:peroxiredoxin